MALQSVPWAIGNGAHNQVEGARLSLYASTGGKGGVMSPADMRVTALPVPGGAVRVHTGGVVVISGYPGASSQAYAARETSSTDVEIDATGSSGPRTRYLVVRVHDHQYSGEPTPEDVQNGPYNEYEWISQDPRTTDLPYPVEGIAKVTQPASTATITQDMIEDIRQLAQPQRVEQVFARPRLSSDDDGRESWLYGQTTRGEYFPGGSGLPNQVRTVFPDWATHVIIEADWLSVFYDSGRGGHGTFWVEFGTERRLDPGWPGESGMERDYEFATQLFGWDQPENAHGHRTNWRLMDTRTVPEKLKGQNVTLTFKAATKIGANIDTRVARMDAISGLGLKLTFVQIIGARGDFL